jgi:ArsR family transcriptional regulator, arsenate/arsenite/antimonite-responsive transcriptional repressor
VDDEAMAAVAKALAHPARIRIVRLLARQTECMGAEVFSELPLAQSTISEHLRVLKEAGIVNATPIGTRTVYCVAPKPLAAFGLSVGELAEASQACSASKGDGR